MKLFLLFSLVAFAAFANPDFEKVIGTNDLTTVAADGANIPVYLRPLIDAFGHMSMGCTATHIGNGYVLTAGHCFGADDSILTSNDCSDTTIEWGYREGLTPYMVSTCEKIVAAQQNDTNDYAIIKVSPVPPVAIAPDLKRRAIIGDTITIFSHPEELPLRYSHLCGIERVQHPDLPKNAFHHTCDTNPGSSGATVINIVSLKVVGIHDGGTTSKGGMNYGTFIFNSPIRETLMELGF